MKNSRVYVGLAADIIHEGHINILKTAKKYGHVTVGLLTDKAIASYKKFPHLSFYQKKIILENIKYVDKVITQKTLDYRPNLIRLKPNYVVHGNDWKTGIQKKTRLDVIKTLKKWSGKLIEPNYTKNISSSMIKKKINEIGLSTSTRVSRLKRLLAAKDIIRIAETHSALNALIIEKSSVIKKNRLLEFDGMWSSSLTDSALKGKPDNQSIDYSSRINSLTDILETTMKPIIFDADNGGRLEHLKYLVKSLERNGVSAIVLEDKIGLKKNSLFKDQKGVKQDTINNFCKKIKVAKVSTISDDFFVIARIESFILNKGIADALKRAERYSKAGADAILIHSKEKTPKEIFQFSKKFSKSKFSKPIVAVPSTYSKTYEKDLIKNGIKIVIYANHFLRSTFPSMEKVANSILKNGRSYETEKFITSINNIINLIK